MEPRKNTLTVCKGEYFEISMLSNAGSTGYNWCISDLEGAVLFWGDEDQVTPPAMPGSPHKKIYKFVAQETGEAKVVFQLIRPWEPDQVIVQNEYTIQIEKSHTQDELKQFVNEDNFPKTPILKYGFIPTASAVTAMYGYPPRVAYGFMCTAKENSPVMPYGVYNTEANKGMVQVHENDERCILKYGFPVSNGNDCLVKYGFMADTSKVK